MIRQISLATTNPDASGVILDGISHPPRHRGDFRPPYGSYSFKLHHKNSGDPQ